MQSVKRHQIRTERTGVADDGTVVEDRTQSVATDTDPKSTFINIVWYIYGIIAVLLALRFILKLTGANPNTGFVDFVYSISSVLSAPFDAIFGTAKASNGSVTSVFEPSIIVAIIVYGLLAWGIAKFADINKPRDTVAS